MAQVNPALPTMGAERGDGESALRSDVQAILNEFNGNIDTANVKPGYFLELLTTGTRRRTAFGQATLAFAASNFATVVVTHGLGITPVKRNRGAPDAVRRDHLVLRLDVGAKLGVVYDPRADLQRRGRDLQYSIDWLAIG
jgi:hypothetical protein